MNSKNDDIDAIAERVCAIQRMALVGPVGSGQFKQVYLVNDAEGEERALKILFSSSNTHRTDREIDAIQRCDHPNIGKIRSIGRVDHSGETHVFIVEDYLGGGTLSSKIKSGELTVSAINQIGCCLSKALSHLDSQQLVHRDLKPENVMFQPGSIDPVLVDFGLVRDLSAVSLTSSWSPQGPGTPIFSPPEQLNNEKYNIDWRSDQFSLGVTLCIAALGIHPYQHGNEHPGLTVERVARRGPHRPGLDNELQKVGLSQVIRMTQPWSVGRYRKTEDLEAAFCAKQR